MHRNKKGRFVSQKKFVRQFRAEEEKINSRSQVTVAERDREDHAYCMPDQDFQLGLGDERDVGANCTVDTKEDEWKSGRRVVELDVLAQRMYCVACKTPLHLSNTEGERRYGLASTLYIRCVNCQVLNDVNTGKRTQRSFDVNTKLALAMVHTGLGPVQVNNLLSAVNLPPIEPSTLKRRELTIDTNLEKMAKESCLEATKEEMTKGNGKVEVSFDGGWQKRGTGWNYDSNTGHGTLIGHETGKVLQFSLRSKSCHVCTLHQNKNHTVPAHECSKNWDGTSKGMEPDMAISMAKEMNEAGCPIDILHGDNDSTTTSRLKAIFPSIEKKDDANHTKKSLTSKFYKLSQKHKILKWPNVISYIARCFMYAIKACQNKDPECLKTALDIVVPHLFGDHSLCAKENVTWCSYRNNPSQFRYRSLPEGKPLSCPDLQKDMLDLVQNLKERSSSLVHLGSTQANENFNFIVSTKAPKSKSFGSSKSLIGRVSASVLQKNEGHCYLTKVNETVGLSPGEFTVNMAKKIAAKRKTQKAKQQSLNGKRQRMVKKIMKSQKESTKGIYEGTTYNTDADLHVTEFKTRQIPPRLRIPTEKTFVAFDIETTGRSKQCDILQIAASARDEKFEVYCQPRCRISEEAFNVHGISFDRNSNSMIHRGTSVDSKPIQDGLLDFIDFVQKFTNPILIGHNAGRFDIPILAKVLKEFSLFSNFSNHVVGYIDTLTISKKVFSKEEVGNFKQETLVKKYTNLSYDAHDAKEDVRALNTLFTEQLESVVCDEDLFHMKFHDIKKNYVHLLQAKCVTNVAVTKLARSGIAPIHLKLAHHRNAGLKLLLKDLGVKLTEKFLKRLALVLEKEE